MAYITETYLITTTKTVDSPGWNAGARTIATLQADGACSFSVEQAIGMVCGLNTNDLSAHYLEITHGFFIEDTRYRVIESGITKTAWAGYAKSATFKIERRWGVVTYWLNDTLVYTSAASSSGTVFLDASLYAYGDTITSVVIEDYYDTPALIAGELAPLIALGVEDTSCWLISELASLSAAGLASDDNRLSGDLAALTGQLATGSVASLTGALASLIGHAETITLIPEYSQLLGELYSLRVNGLQYDPDPGTLNASLSPLIAFGADQDVTLLAGALSPLDAEIVLGEVNYLATSWADWYSLSQQLDAHTAVVAITFPAPILTAHAHQRDNAQVLLNWPAPIFTIQGGGSVRLSFPALTLTATATSPGFAQATITWPAPTLTATAKAGARADVALDWPAWTLAAQGGGSAELNWPSFMLTAAGSVVYAAQTVLDWPSFTLTATAKTGAVATATLNWPSFTLDSHGWVGGLATVTLTFPAWGLTADDGTTVHETTYAVNLTTGAVTTLLLGEITRLVTAHGRLYGLRGDELVRLDGDTDGAEPIPATVRFAPQTFGSNRAKRLSTVYIESREDDGLTLDVIADEQVAWRYQTATDTARAYGTHKVKVGRGVKFHTAGLVVKNRNGGRMDIGGMELLVDTGAPRPKS